MTKNEVRQIRESIAALKEEVETLSYAVAASYMKIESLSSGVHECKKAPGRFLGRGVQQQHQRVRWLRGVGFSPTGCAAGYQLLEVLCRILDEKKPKTILDVGLGQTSKMIARSPRSTPPEKYCER